LLCLQKVEAKLKVSDATRDKMSSGITSNKSVNEVTVATTLPNIAALGHVVHLNGRKTGITLNLAEPGDARVTWWTWHYSLGSVHPWCRNWWREYVMLEPHCWTWLHAWATNHIVIEYIGKGKGI